MVPFHAYAQLQLHNHLHKQISQHFNDDCLRIVIGRCLFSSGIWPERASERADTSSPAERAPDALGQSLLNESVTPAALAERRVTRALLEATSTEVSMLVSSEEVLLSRTTALRRSCSCAALIDLDSADPGAVLAFEFDVAHADARLVGR